MMLKWSGEDLKSPYKRRKKARKKTRKKIRK
jgi:hypothetical protein